MAYDVMYFGNNCEQRRVDDLFIMRFTLAHIILLMDTLSKFKDVLPSNDPVLDYVLTIFEVLKHRILYFECFVKDSDIKEIIKKLGSIDYRNLCKNWNTLKEDISLYLPIHSEDGIEPCGQLLDMRDSEETLIEDVVRSLNIPKKKNQLRFNNGVIVLNGISNQIVDLDTIQGTILKMAIKNKGKPVKSCDIEEQLEKNEKINYDFNHFDPAKSLSAATKEINLKAHELFSIDFNLLIYKKKTVRLSDYIDILS